jgi:TPR repeat protein
MARSPIKTVDNKAKTINEVLKQIAAGERLSRDSVSTKGKADELFLQGAASTGSATAQYKLGRFYLKAKTIPNHHQLEFKWMTLAAQQGYAPAQWNVGLAYAIGEVVPRDLTKAFEWNYKAATQGYSDSQVCLSDAYQHGWGVQLDVVQAYKWLKVAIEKGEAFFNPIWGDLEDYISDSASMRERLEKLIRKMTPEQIAEGERLSKEFVRLSPR